MTVQLMSGTPWMTVADTAKYARRHEKTVLAALRKGDLVGYQARAGCSWRIYQADLDAWIRGDKPKRKRP